ncbi:MAG: hypothetical protein ACYTBJ_15765 [Planctomycetota bacterium]|jgi:polygalacturonase
MAKRKNVTTIMAATIVGWVGLQRADTITVGPGPGYDFGDIQRAIDNANDGHTVIVSAGRILLSGVTAHYSTVKRDDFSEG